MQSTQACTGAPTPVLNAQEMTNIYLPQLKLKGARSPNSRTKARNPVKLLAEASPRKERSMVVEEDRSYDVEKLQQLETSMSRELYETEMLVEQEPDEASRSSFACCGGGSAMPVSVEGAFMDQTKPSVKPKLTKTKATNPEGEHDESVVLHEGPMETGNSCWPVRTQPETLMYEGMQQSRPSSPKKKGFSLGTCVGGAPVEEPIMTKDLSEFSEREIIEGPFLTAPRAAQTTTVCSGAPTSLCAGSAMERGAYDDMYVLAESGDLVDARPAVQYQKQQRSVDMIREDAPAAGRGFGPLRLCEPGYVAVPEVEERKSYSVSIFKGCLNAKTTEQEYEMLGDYDVVAA